MSEILLIGDVHGKWEQYADLLKKYSPDRSIQIGDLGWGFVVSFILFSFYIFQSEIVSLPVSPQYGQVTFSLEIPRAAAFNELASA